MTQLLLSKDLQKYMKKHEHVFLKVHSVFKDAMNIIDDKGNLVTLVSPNKDIAPMSAQVSLGSIPNQHLESGELVEIDGDTLLFPRLNIKLNFKDHEIWNPDYQKRKTDLSMNQLESRVMALKDLIETHGQLEGIVELIKYLDFSVPGIVSTSVKQDLNQYADFIEERVLKVLNLVYEGNYELLKEFIPRFVGFGPGLTPSTDDFLLGLIISHIYERRKRGELMKDIYSQISKVVESTEEKTTKVSVEMLKHGVRGKVSESYRLAVQAMFYDVKASFSKTCIRVLQNGSTSGSDYLFGVYCYAQLRLKWYREGGI